ncbi:hypothetical protein Hdeb2414_s0002g00060171 [Helianthus debilis subsp. tardiflorus]
MHTHGDLSPLQSPKTNHRNHILFPPSRFQASNHKGWRRLTDRQPHVRKQPPPLSLLNLRQPPLLRWMKRTTTTIVGWWW